MRRFSLLLRLALRYSITGAKDRFFFLVSAMAVAGIAFGTAALIVVLAVMSGFEREFTDRVLSVTSHIEILPRGVSLAELTAQVEDYEGVVATAPSITRRAIVSHGRRNRPVLMRAVEPQSESAAVEWNRYSGEDVLRHLKPDLSEVVIGHKLAAQLGLSVGDDLLVLIPSVQGGLTAFGYLPQIFKFKVAGTLKTGLHEFDQTIVLLHIDRMAALLGTEKGDFETLRVRVENPYLAPEVANRLRADLENSYVEDWTKSNQGLVEAIALEKRAMLIVLSMIVWVATFNLIAAMTIMVRNKLSDMAILRTMGMTTRELAGVFTLQGLMISILGMLLGIGLGTVIANNLQVLIDVLEQQFKFKLLPDVYQLNELPAQVLPEDLQVIVIVVVILSVLSSFIPALRCTRLSIKDCLGHHG